MKLGIFCVHDIKARAHLPPFFLPRVEVAQRVFADCVNSSTHQFGAHPEDYTLLHLGVFDDETAQFECFDIPRSLGLGVTFVRAVPDERVLEVVRDVQNG